MLDMPDLRRARLAIAAAYVPLPVWVARSVTVPAPVSVSVPPLRVAGPETTATVTGSPELAVALTAKGASPKVLSPRAGKVIA